MSDPYVLCVNFMLRAAALTGLTYRDVNVLILLIAFPAITLACVAGCFVPYRRRG